MNLFVDIEVLIKDCLAALQQEDELPKDLSFERLVVEPPRDSSHGDMATNAAMLFAKPARTNPRALADKLVPLLLADPRVSEAEVAGPGFINLRLEHSVWAGALRRILAEGGDFGRQERAEAPPIHVEYVSANPTGPLHGGHIRGAVFGDALANLLEFAGHKVLREYYVNDSGGQIQVLVQSAFLRYREALGEVIGEIPPGLYPGEYLKAVGQALKTRFGDTLLAQAPEAWFEPVRALTVEMMLSKIKTDLKALGVNQEVFYSEHSMTSGGQDLVAETLDDLKALGLLYTGRLPPPKGKVDEDWEDREQLLFRSSDFGDNQDRPLLKSDGSYTYFANDVAYHALKVKRGFQHLVNVWGADHAGHITRMKAAVKALSEGRAELDVKVCQIVHLLRDGEQVKMSKRSGEFLTLDDILQEVGKDVIRFIMLTRSNDAQLDFDFVKVQEKSKDNPVFYVQYAHARTWSVERQAGEAGIAVNAQELARENGLFDALTDSSEQEIIRQLATFPRLILQAAESHEPHRIAFYCLELAAKFHALWNKGKEHEDLRFIKIDNLHLTHARLGLTLAVRQILVTCMHLLGVESVKEMR